MTQKSLSIDEIYISVDVETSGPIPSEYSLLSLGASVVGNPTSHFYAEIKPLNENAVPEALAVTGFSLANLAEQGEEPRAALQRFQEWIVGVSTDNRKPIFVGFNAGFDWSFVNWYFHKYLGQNPFGFSPLDIKAYYMGLSGRKWAQTTSKQIPASYQPKETFANHNALADAQAQAEIFYNLLHAHRAD